MRTKLTISCACGCGEMIPRINKRRELAKYKHGHNPITHLAKFQFKKGQKSTNYKGGKMKDSYGYYLILNRDHPFADARGYVREHRLIMEKNLGRYLTKDEVVHHINGIKTDNRIKNLRLMTNSEHSIIHVRIDMSKRKCSECGNNKTYYNIEKRFAEPRPIWVKHPVTKEGWLCGKCYRQALRKK